MSFMRLVDILQGIFFFFFCLKFQAKFREVVSFDKHVLLKKLRDVLESLRGRVAGRNKDDVEEAISMVCFPLLDDAQKISRLCWSAPKPIRFGYICL